MRDGCQFCDYEGPSEVLQRTERSFVIEPIAPVAPGHVLVIPLAHITRPGVPQFGETLADAVWWGVLGISDFNLILSVGAAATQTVEHLHVHVVPRGDDDGLALPWTGQARG